MNDVLRGKLRRLQTFEGSVARPIQELDDLVKR